MNSDFHGQKRITCMLVQAAKTFVSFIDYSANKQTNKSDQSRNLVCEDNACLFLKQDSE